MTTATRERDAVQVPMVPNFIGGYASVPESDRSVWIRNPGTGLPIAQLCLSAPADLDVAVRGAVEAQRAWALIAVKDRIQVLFRLKALMEGRLEPLAQVIHEENGKTVAEAKGSILRGIECIEFATSLPQLMVGPALEVSRGVECKMVRYPLGVVAGITPFNFPMMVPLWMAPLAIACGNAFILKPSEQTPLGGVELAKLFAEAGLPAGIFSVVHGDRVIVEAICDHPDIQAVGFVGSTKVARAVHARATAAHKRVRALGGAKNHLIVVPDADPELTVQNIVASVTGCAGQRCMAGSVLLAVGDIEPILDRIKATLAALVPGQDFGPVISSAARDRIAGYNERATANGAKVTVDGRKAKRVGDPAGYYIGASVIEAPHADHEAVCDEIFGPTLTIVRCETLSEALTIENASPYGNAAAVYTTSGLVAQYVSERASAGMVGVNIGVPVPREPFPFGGWNDSTFGGGDLTGEPGIDFWTKMKKITTKWSDEHRSNWMS